MSKLQEHAQAVTFLINVEKFELPEPDDIVAKISLKFILSGNLP